MSDEPSRGPVAWTPPGAVRPPFAVPADARDPGGTPPPGEPGTGLDPVAAAAPVGVGPGVGLALLCWVPTADLELLAGSDGAWRLAGLALALLALTGAVLLIAGGAQREDGRGPLRRTCLAGAALVGLTAALAGVTVLVNLLWGGPDARENLGVASGLAGLAWLIASGALGLATLGYVTLACVALSRAPWAARPAHRPGRGTALTQLAVAVALGALVAGGLTLPGLHRLHWVEVTVALIALGAVVCSVLQVAGTRRRTAGARSRLAAVAAVINLVAVVVPALVVAALGLVLVLTGGVLMVFATLPVLVRVLLPGELLVAGYAAVSLVTLANAFQDLGDRRVSPR